MYVYMPDRSPTTLVAALTASVALVVAVVVAWASPAAAVLPSFSGPTTVPVTTNSTITLTGSKAPQVVDPDSTSLAVLLSIAGPSVGRPTFSLDGTTGLVVTGSTVRSRSAGIAGTRSAINAALDGMRIEGGAPDLDYTLTLVADEAPDAPGGSTSRVITVDQHGTRPVNDMGSTFTVGTRAALTLSGPTAPQVTDVDSPVLEVELNIGTSQEIPEAEQPTFTLDGTSGLTVSGGSAAATRFVEVSGTIAALDAALDGMVVTGGTTGGLFRIVLETDDVVADGAGDGDLADTDFTNFTVTSEDPFAAGLRSATLGTSSTRVLPPITVGDPDSPVLDVELGVARRAPDTTSTRPTLSLPTTEGLTVTTSPGATGPRVVGPVAALNAALAGVVVTATAATTTGQYDMVLRVDDGPDAAAGANISLALATLTVTGTPPTVSAGPDLTIGTNAVRLLGSAAAPSVGDADDDRVEVTVEVQRTGGDTTSSRPRFDFPTTGLSVTSGSPTGSSLVTVAGPPAAIDTALDDMGLVGGSSPGGYRLVVTVDEAVGSTVGQVATDTANITVTALAPILTAPISVSPVSSTTLVLDGDVAPKVTDADSPEVDVEVRLLPVPSSATVGTRFSLDGTAGLTVSGSATSSTQVLVTGSLSALNAALDGLLLTAPATAEQFNLQLTVDDDPGAGTGHTATRTVSGTVTAVPPGSIAGQSFTVASHTTSAPRIGFNAPQVSDADSPVVDVVVTTSSAGGLPTADQPTFTLDPLTGLVLVSGTSLASHAVALRGSPSAVNAALDGMVVRGGPTAGTFGIVVAVDDVPGTGGTPATATTVVTVTDAVPAVTVPGPAHAHPGQTRDVPVTVSDGDSVELEARVRVLGTTAGRPQVRVTAPAGLVVDAGPVTGTDDLQVHGPTAAVASALAGLRVVAGTAVGTFTVEVTVDDARPEVGNVVTRTFTVAVDPPPSAPTGVGAQARSGGIGVSWSPPAAPGPNALTGYRVRVLQGATQVATADVGPAARTRAFDGLVNGTSFTVEVQALTALGPGAAATAGPVTPRVFAPFASAGALVDRLFLDLLGRAPTAAERSAAVGGIGAGTLTPAGLVAQLRASADNTGNVDPVTRLYRAYFLRIPDQAGLDFWIAGRRSGRSLNQISQSFAQSPEFATLYGSLTNRGFVERIYENVLGRPGEPDGVAFWTGQLDSGARTRGQVMTGFSESSEYRAQQRAEVDVSVAYIALLGRRPTNVEHADAVAGIEGGSLTLAALHAAILTGDEYRDLVT